MKIFPLLALVAGACCFASCTPQNTENTLDATPAPPSKPASISQLTPTPKPNPRVSKTALKAVWVPGSDDFLHAAKISSEKTAPVAALNQILVLAPQFYPKGTKILGFKDAGAHYEINLNAAFNNEDFWSKNGAKTTELALYALTNTAGQIEDGSGVPTPDGHPVALLLEGKKLDVLGEFDLSDALPPNPDLNSQTPFKTPQKPSKNAS